MQLRSLTFLLILSFSLFGSGCGNDDEPDMTVECGGFGELHNGHCDCDDGYEHAAGNDLLCVTKTEECGGHGELHDDHCDCDAGYKTATDNKLLCVADKEECGGHGHLHDGHCDCDDGYKPAADNELLCIADAEPKPTPIGRLLVADGNEGRVVVVDLKMGKAIASLATNGPARVYANSNNTRGFAVQNSAGAVQGIEPGLRFVSHGDHYDAEVSAPAVLEEVAVSCERPVHWVAHDGHAATFCDGDGMLHVFEDEGTQQTFDITSYSSGRAHHGVGLVSFGHVLLSMPNTKDEMDALPIGVRALSLAGDEVSVFDSCSKLHGEVSIPGHVCFGCADGVMCISKNAEGTLESKKIANPEGAAEGVRVGRFAAAGDVLVGNWGNDLTIIDPANGTLKPLAVGEAYLAFKVTHDGEHVIVLTDSGKIQKIHLADGDVEATHDLIPAFTREAGHGQLRPNMLLADDYAYVVDPRNSEVYEVDLSTLELSERSIELEEGNYHSLALVATYPEDGHDH